MLLPVAIHVLLVGTLGRNVSEWWVNLRERRKGVAGCGHNPPANPTYIHRNDMLVLELDDLFY